jgi:hypothetical protein
MLSIEYNVSNQICKEAVRSQCSCHTDARSASDSAVCSIFMWLQDHTSSHMECNKNKIVLSQPYTWSVFID